MTDVFPTADQVARAIIAACREVSADPIAVASGDRGGYGGDYSISRARVYAGFALDKVFTECGPASIKRMVASRTDISTMRFQIANGKATWFDKAALARVIAAIDCTGPRQEERPEPVPAPSPFPRPKQADSRKPVPTSSALPNPPAKTASPRTGLDRFASRRYGSEDGRQVGSADHLTRVAVDRRSLKEMLAEAVRNTAKIPIPKEPEGEN